MKEYRPIQVGDIVRVFFSNGESTTDMEVKNVPCSNGDCWHLWNRDLKYVQYVQQFEFMNLAEPKEDR